MAISSAAGYFCTRDRRPRIPPAIHSAVPRPGAKTGRTTSESFMTLKLSSCPPPVRRLGALRLAALAVTVGVALLAGCNKTKDKAATQTAAKVNKEEITVHQINFLLSQQRAIPQAQAASASRQVLE